MILCTLILGIPGCKQEGRVEGAYKPGDGLVNITSLAKLLSDFEDVGVLSSMVG
jgi:hypothetical protein